MESKINFLLNFESSFIEARYKKEIFEQLHFQMISLMLSSEAVWIGCYLLFPSFGIPKLLLGCLTFVISIFFIYTDKSPLLFRALYGLAEIFLIMYVYQENFSVSTLLILNSIEFGANLVCLFSWYTHLIISLLRGIFCVFYFETFIFQQFSLYCADILMILLSAMMFGSLEKLLKENWLRLDNSKKAQNAMAKLSDSIMEPIFLVDSMGVILYLNKSGENLVGPNETSKRKTIISIVIEKDQPALGGAIRAVNREGKQKLIVKIPFKSQFSLPEYGKIQIIEPEKEIKCNTYKLKLDRFVWKGHNCVFIICYDITEIIMILEMSLINQYRIRERIDASKFKLLEIIKTMPKQKEKLGQLLDEEAKVGFDNEQSISATKMFLRKTGKDEEHFVLDNFLMYFMELHNHLALSKNVGLSLNTDPCNPREVGIDRRQLEILLSAFLSFIIEHESPNEKVTLQVTLKELQNNLYLIRFSFIFSSNEELTYSLFSSLVSKLFHLKERNVVQKYELIRQLGFSLVSSGEVLSQLGGEAEVNLSPTQKINVHLNLPFSCMSEDKHLTNFVSIGLFELERVSKYSIRWGKPKIILEEAPSTACKATNGFSDVIENEEKKKQAQEKSKEKLLASIKRKHMWARSKSTMLQGNAPETNLQENIKSEENQKILETRFPSFEENQEISGKSRSNLRKHFGDFSSILLASKSRTFQPQQEEQKGKIQKAKKLSSFSKLYQASIMQTTAYRKWVKPTEVNKNSPQSSEEFKLKHPKVLIVEDNDFNILPIKNTLVKNRIEFDVARNGIMAVERYQRTMDEGLIYAVIFMDIEMPLLNGFEATEDIRKLEASKSYAHTFICGLSAATDHGVEMRCLRCGMDQYIPKPINMELMMKIIQTQFDHLQSL